MASSLNVKSTTRYVIKGSVTPKASVCVKHWNPTARDLDSLEEHARKSREERQKSGDLGSWKRFV